MQSALWIHIRLGLVVELPPFIRGRPQKSKKTKNPKALHLSAPCWPSREAPRWSGGRRLALCELPGAASSKVNTSATSRESFRLFRLAA